MTRVGEFSIRLENVYHFSYWYSTVVQRQYFLFSEQGRPKWVCGYRFGIDPLSGKSLHHASFLLRHFIPVELVRDEAHQKIIEGNLEERDPRLFPLPNEKVWTFTTGSRAEGLAIPDYYFGGKLL